jgi:hypothetical protein
MQSPDTGDNRHVLGKSTWGADGAGLDLAHVLTLDRRGQVHVSWGANFLLSAPYGGGRGLLTPAVETS